MSPAPSRRLLRRNKTLERWLMAALGLAAVGFLLWGFWIEPSSLRNEETVLEPPGWSAECDGLRVAVLADIHVGSPWNGLSNLERIVDLTNAARPDLVLLAGDYVIHGVPGGQYVEPEDIARGLAGLEATIGVFAVLGNHDWWIGPEEVGGALEAVGIPLLEDRALRLTRGACSLWLVGISDLWEGPHDVDAALAEVTGDEPALAFTHNPDVFPKIPARVSLTVAGHTHGGQVYLPGIGRPVVPSRYGQSFAVGHVVVDGRHLYVSSGIGTSILPVRFLVPPEVTVLELRSKAGKTPRRAPLQSP